MDKVICVGKNYLKHALELGDAVPEEALYFFKPPSTILSATEAKTALILPEQGEIHHEVELVLEIVGDHFTRFTIGLDLTLRDVQNRLKKAGQPWEKAKVFKNATVLGPWRKIANLDEVMTAKFSLSVNGQMRQQGQGLDMRFKPPELLADLRHYFPVLDGDILFTGTPEGVGPLVHGDELVVQGLGLEYSLRVDRAI